MERRPRAQDHSRGSGRVGTGADMGQPGPGRKPDHPDVDLDTDPDPDHQPELAQPEPADRGPSTPEAGELPPVARIYERPRTRHDWRERQPDAEIVARPAMEINAGQ